MNYRKMFVVKPGEKIRLDKIDPDFTDDVSNKQDGAEKTSANAQLLADLQYKLYAENRQSLLIILQAMDAGGKDGTIAHVLSPMNPQGCRVQGFKAPSADELEHDFLWRIHRVAPRNGEVVIFNRSHYEDVLVVRVHDLVPQSVWSRRYEFINDFEKMLTARRTRVVKFFLHISKEEQLKRFEKRLDEKDKHWKISAGDYQERQYWDDYMAAFEDALSRCSTADAPWYVIPSNHKWFRNLAVSQILVETMQDMKMALPKPTVNIEEIRKLAAAEWDKMKKKE
ncbi:MAG: polyphosphate kinase 2 family protein [Victivallales bacterium]|nr:polyphosphate kinase 2 family protein [Victivallales bacterium]